MQLLSVWQCTKEIDDISQVALALATPEGKTSIIEGITVVLINKSYLLNEDFTLIPSPGSSLIKDLNEKHLDVKLDAPKLIRLATEITLKVRNDFLVYLFF